MLEDGRKGKVGFIFGPNVKLSREGDKTIRKEKGKKMSEGEKKRETRGNEKVGMEKR